MDRKKHLSQAPFVFCFYCDFFFGWLVICNLLFLKPVQDFSFSTGYSSSQKQDSKSIKK
jgi:hypothetical protein